MIICDKCGSNDIHQEASIMLPINDFAGPLKEYNKILEDLEWQDHYWCKKCDDECHTIIYSKTKVKK